MRKENTALTMMSFNIRCSCDSGSESWELRRENLIPLVLSEAPDCIGFQEVETDQFPDLVHALTAYAYVGKPREDGVAKGERAAIFYKKERFDSVDTGDFWLSETPDVPSRGWDAVCTRICTYVGLQDRATENRFYHFNTHLDHMGQTAMLEGARLIGSFVKTKELPAFITGDFNVREGSAPYKAMLESGLTDAKYSARECFSYGTFHGYEPSVYLKDESPIDYLFYTNGDFSVAEYKVLVNGRKGAYTSDHYPIRVKMVQNEENFIEG